MIRVLTVEREYGSGGADIARKVAERLPWRSMRSEEIPCTTGSSKPSCAAAMKGV
jgi:hypothetical protein